MTSWLLADLISVREAVGLADLMPVVFLFLPFVSAFLG